MMVSMTRFPGSARLTAALTAAALSLSTLGACTTNTATGESQFTAFMSPEQELRVGAQEHPKILAQFGGEYTEVPALNAYIQDLGMDLAKLSEQPDLPYQFTILNDEAINAFALPGGYVYITRGLLALADSEAEVAGVLGHEIGHVTARHTAERYSRAVATSIGASILGTVAGAYGARGAGQLINTGAQLYLQAFSREQEMQSDTLGVRYMTRAGYDPSGLTSFFHKLKGSTELRAAELGRPELADQYSAMASHPRTDDRIVNAIKLARENRPPNPRFGRERLMEMVEGMVFRDHPDQGIRRGRLFQHPGLRIEFKAPPDFVLLNSPSSVQAVGPEGATITFDAAPPASARPYADVRDFLVREWAPRLKLDGVQRITVNGMEGATGAASGLRTNSGPRDVRLVAIRRDRDTIFRFAFLSPSARTAALNEEFRRMTYSFRTLSEAEAAVVKPMRIGLHTVRQGDTVESLAETMPMERFKIEWFELLNAVDRGTPLVPGSLVKVVVEG
jgi:predicted Zn-dependent protease